MKKSILLLIAIFGILSSQAFAETTADESATEGGSADQATCVSGFCPAPVYSKPATLISPLEARQTVNSVLGEVDVKDVPPEPTSSKTHK